MGENTPGDGRNEWLFDINFQRPERRFRCGRAKYYLYEVLHKSVTQHDIGECYRLLSVLAMDITLDPYILFRFIMILVESNPTNTVNKEVVFALESLLSRLDISKPDAYVEYLTYFIRHNRLDDARDLHSQRNKFVAYRTHRSVPFVDINICCYEFLLNYQVWNERIASEDRKNPIDVSIQGWIVNVVQILREVQGNYEYFMFCVVRMLLYYGYCKKAYLVASTFQRNNRMNIGAQLLLLHVINQLGLDPESITMASTYPEDYVDVETVSQGEQQEQNRLNELEFVNNFSDRLKDEVVEADELPLKNDRRQIMKSLQILDPGGPELMALTEEQPPLDQFINLMDGMEVVSEIRNIDRWRYLEAVLNSMAGDRNSQNQVISIWRQRYKKYWLTVDFLSLAGNNLSRSDRSCIKTTIKLLATEFGRKGRR